MSAPPAQFPQRAPGTAPLPPPAQSKATHAEKKEDCRDYLRTGRCKYGASCKYNHPSNVQSGGGMRAPLDPSEPLFPVRPNEPFCQYYMKHGTCKFGQACKFNHPPQSQLPMSVIAGVGNSMSGGVRVGDGSSSSSQLNWNGDSNNVHMLPQRPEEPNCIFFLKNGRCKYGATCRYHHPLNYHERRTIGANDEYRRQGVQQGGGGEGSSQIHYVTSLPPGSYQQGHFVVADGTVTFLSLDGSPTQVISVPQGSKETVVYTQAPQSRPLVNSRDVISSSSSASIASSYETASSNLDMMGNHGDSSSSLWNRPNRSTSGGSLAAYSLQDPGSRQHLMQGGRTVLVQNVNDPGINLPRVASTSSSASDNGTVYYEANSGQGRHPTGPQGQVQNGGMWRNRRSNSFDRNGYHGRNEDDLYESAPPSVMHDNKRPAMPRGRQQQGGRGRRMPQQQPREVDEGLSMMTSALLTMLDTPEEATAEQQEEYFAREQLQPGLRNDFPSRRSVESFNNSNNPRMYGNGQYQSSNSYYDQNQAGDIGLPISDQRNHVESGYEHSSPSESNQEYSSWQEHMPSGRSYHENAQGLSMMQHQPSNNSTHNASNVGLYLP